ncbi:MAG: hypothetical protein J0H50_05920 [Xanthomonadales bacterium]|nr:hypothetical protein [Xanthomonadales bacterium]
MTKNRTCGVIFAFRWINATRGGEVVITAVALSGATDTALPHGKNHRAGYGMAAASAAAPRQRAMHHIGETSTQTPDDLTFNLS